MQMAKSEDRVGYLSNRGQPIEPVPGEKSEQRGVIGQVDPGGQLFLYTSGQPVLATSSISGCLPFCGEG